MAKSSPTGKLKGKKKRDAMANVLKAVRKASKPKYTKTASTSSGWKTSDAPSKGWPKGWSEWGSKVPSKSSSAAKPSPSAGGGGAKGPPKKPPKSTKKQVNAAASTAPKNPSGAWKYTSTMGATGSASASKVRETRKLKSAIAKSGVKPKAKTSSVTKGPGGTVSRKVGNAYETQTSNKASRWATPIGTKIAAKKKSAPAKSAQKPAAKPTWNVTMSY